MILLSSVSTAEIFFTITGDGDTRTLTTISNSSEIIVLNGGGDTKHCSHIAAMLRGNGELQTYSEQC